MIIFNPKGAITSMPPPPPQVKKNIVLNNLEHTKILIQNTNFDELFLMILTISDF